MNSEHLDQRQRPRIQVQALCVADAELYRTLYTDSATMRMVCAPLTVEQADRSFRAALRSAAMPHPQRIFASLRQRSDGIAMGLSGASFDDASRRQAEIGILLLTEMRGCGYAVEALGEFLRWLHAVHGTQRVWADFAVGHAVVEHMLDKLGFQAVTGAVAGRQRASLDVGLRGWSTEPFFHDRGEDDGYSIGLA